MLKKIVEYPYIALLAILASLNYALFIFPNSFAPAGLDGICTMIQDVTQISMGYMALLANIPLLVVAFFVLNREFAFKTATFVVVFSLTSVLLREVDLSAFVYHTGTGTSVVLAPVAAGAIRGILYALTLKVNASSGGIDILAAVVRRSKPHLNMMNIVFVINFTIAFSSYFVYGFQLEPVICSIIYAFITTSISNHLRFSNRELVKFEIVAADAEGLCQQIFEELHRTATIMDAHGAYSGEDKKMIVCVLEKQKAPALEQLIRTLPDAVFFKSTVTKDR